jgi:copper ion binding protein
VQIKNICNSEENKMKKLSLLTIVTAMAFTFTAFTCNAQESNRLAVGQTTGQNQTTTELTVWGMTCNRCVRQVTNAVSALEGVARVSVNLRGQRVTVIHDSRTNAEAIKRAIEAQGFNVP